MELAHIRGQLMAIDDFGLSGTGSVHAVTPQSTHHAIRLLCARLAQFGGCGLCDENGGPYLREVIHRGQLFTGKRVKAEGEPNKCHTNSSKLFLKSEGRLRLCTGFALTEEGWWVQHSWCVTHPDARRHAIGKDTTELFSTDARQ